MLIAQSLTEALARLNERTDVGTCFVIGGGQVYADALRSPECHRVYMTRVRPAAAAVDADIACDTFFPDLTSDTTDFTLLDTAQTEQELSWAQPLRRVENGLEYEFQIYERRAADAVDKENEAASQ